MYIPHHSLPFEMGNDDTVGIWPASSKQSVGASCRKMEHTERRPSDAMLFGPHANFPYIPQGRNEPIRNGVGEEMTGPQHFGLSRFTSSDWN